MNADDAELLLRYNRWANDRALKAAEALTPAQFVQDLGSSYRSVRDTMTHIVWAEWLYLQRVQGRSPQLVFDPAAFPTVAALRERWEPIAVEQATLVRTLTREALARVVSYTNLRGEVWAYPLRDLLRHVVNHSTYHRGQVATLLRQLGVEPRPTDFLLFLDEARSLGA